MVSRRQEKFTRLIKEVVSDIILNRLSDPRIDGIISVTQVDISPDLRNAEVYLSIMAANDKVRKRTFTAIEHARVHIQSQLVRRMTSKFCPRLHFQEDRKLRKTLETLRIIEEAGSELKERDSEDEHESRLD